MKISHAPLSTIQFYVGFTGFFNEHHLCTLSTRKTVFRLSPKGLLSLQFFMNSNQSLEMS